jgi:hypothetical protein
LVFFPLRIRPKDKKCSETEASLQKMRLLTEVFLWRFNKTPAKWQIFSSIPLQFSLAPFYFHCLFFLYLALLLSFFKFPFHYLKRRKRER